MTTEILETPVGTREWRSTTPALTSEQAIRKANGYLTMYVGMFFGAIDPVLLPLEQPIWQVTAYFQMYDIGPFVVGLLDVDATTGTVEPLIDAQIETILDRADAFVKGHPSTTATSV